MYAKARTAAARKSDLRHVEIQNSVRKTLANDLRQAVGRFSANQRAKLEAFGKPPGGRAPTNTSSLTGARREGQEEGAGQGRPVPCSIVRSWALYGGRRNFLGVFSGTHPFAPVLGMAHTERKGRGRRRGVGGGGVRREGFHVPPPPSHFGQRILLQSGTLHAENKVGQENFTRTSMRDPTGANIDPFKRF